MSELNTGKINDEDCCALAEMLFAQPDCDRTKPYSVLDKGVKRRFPKAMSNLGWHFICEGKPSAEAGVSLTGDAVELLQRAVPMIAATSQGKVCALLGAAYLKQGKNADAYDMLKRASAQLNDAAVANNMGVAAYKLGSYPDAAAYFSQALEAAASDREKLIIGYNLGAALFGDARRDEAAAAADAAAQLEECEIADKYDLARLYYNMGSYDKVCAIIPQSKASVVPNVKDFLVYACSLFEQGKRDELASYYNEVTDYCLARRKEASYDATEKKYEQLLEDIKNAYSTVVRGEKPAIAPEVIELVGDYLY